MHRGYTFNEETFQCINCFKCGQSKENRSPACAERLMADYLEIKDRLFGEKSAADIYAEMSEWKKGKG